MAKNIRIVEIPGLNLSYFTCPNCGAKVNDVIENEECMYRKCSVCEFQDDDD
jgi:predicted RNA-binding Zn-ribbon protein involved in translation (DUF1610 family)